MLQPGYLFESLPERDIPELKRTDKDKFWIIPYEEYAEVVKKQIKNSKLIPSNSKAYLSGLVDYMNGKIDTKQVENLYNNTGKEIEERKIITDFGEILGPFFAWKFLRGKGIKDIHNVVFPIRQNYEIFDFFIKDGHHYGFSSKALTGGSNTLAPKLIQERIDAMKKHNDFKNYRKELTVIKNLTDGGMFEGVVTAFGSLLGDTPPVKFDISATDLKKMFSGVNFQKDSIKIEKNKNKNLSGIGLSKPSAYIEFLNRFIIESTKVPVSEKQKFKTGQLPYTTTNLVYGLIKFIASKDFKFDEIMKQAFQDLNIVKMGMKNGVPIFKMQTTVEAENTVTNNNYVFRSKAAFDRVKDKVGIQL